MSWQPILLFIGGALLLWMVYRSIKNNPAAYSKENISKSFFTMGILALALIAFVYMLVLLVK